MMMLNKCSECGSRKLEHNNTRGEVICRDCGLILEDSQIAQDYVSESVKKSAMNPYLSIAETKGVDGRIFKNIWLLSTREKNLRFGNSKIESLSGRLNLPSIVLTEAKIIFKSAIEKDLAIGRNGTSMIYASVYTACIMHKIPKTPLEIIIHSNTSKKQLLRAYKIIKNGLELNIKPMDPADLIPRFASKLDLNPITVTMANEMLMKINNTNLIYGRRPETIVASVLYLASKQNNEPRTQRQIANTIGVIEVTIRKMSKELTNILNIY